ncbi:MAG: hypothetical protein H0V09_06550, partial [Gemmatimonadetes bacterium]|nr:hypothetical protein [Gemmatimonadota bacterium]
MSAFSPFLSPFPRLFLLAALPALVSCASEAAKPAPDPLAQRIRKHVRHLGSDELEGRAPGQPGGDAAVRYIEGRLRALGLEPAGTEGFRQPVPLQGVRTLPETRFTWTPAGADS